MMAQDGGVDPHGIAAAHGFLDRFRGRPESSCVLEVPARLERAITDLQSAALANLAMEPDGCRGQDSNPHIAAYEAVALPNRLPCKLVTPAGFEPGISGVRVLRPDRLD